MRGCRTAWRAADAHVTTDIIREIDWRAILQAHMDDATGEDIGHWVVAPLISRHSQTGAISGRISNGLGTATLFGKGFFDVGEAL